MSGPPRTVRFRTPPVSERTIATFEDALKRRELGYQISIEHYEAMRSVIDAWESASSGGEVFFEDDE
jgi:hypothetical protein